MYIGLFDLGDNTWNIEIVPADEVNEECPAMSALDYAADQEWGWMPGYMGLFLKVGGQ